ncbi:MAG: GNAT family N-acetyltransferase [Fuerstiella sp.]|nr:GNAT family N-acetyltransferase [Fuerstiella sp.]
MAGRSAVMLGSCSIDQGRSCRFVSMETALFEVATLTDATEEQRLCEIQCQSFGLSTDYWERYVSRIGRTNFRVIRRAGRVIGGLGIYHAGQWFGGRCLDMAGIAAVAIAPEDRSSGAAAHLMASALTELQEQGVPISALYPTTQRLYRRSGYEQAGSCCLHRLSLNSIQLRQTDVSLTRIEGVHHEPCHELARTRARITNGNLERNTGLWERAVTFPYADKSVYRYLVGESDQPEGYLIFYYDADKPGPFNICVRDMMAVSPGAARTIWAFLSSYRSVATSVSWNGPAVEPLLLLPAELKAEVVSHERWMLRLVDVRGALCARGYLPHVDAELHLEITDDIVSANNGRFILNVANGSATIRDGGRGDLKAHVRGLSPLFSGFLSPVLLRHMGHIDAGDQTVATATSIFSGPPPWMPDRF